MYTLKYQDKYFLINSNGVSIAVAIYNVYQYTSNGPGGLPKAVYWSLHLLIKKNNFHTITILENIPGLVASLPGFAAYTVVVYFFFLVCIFYCCEVLHCPITQVIVLIKLMFTAW